MPLRRTKTYQVVTAAAAASTRPVPENPGRIALLVQNTSANPGNMRFGGPTLNNGSDLLFAAGAVMRWDQSDTCPTDSLNFSSTLAASWSVVETIPAPN